MNKNFKNTYKQKHSKGARQTTRNKFELEFDLRQVIIQNDSKIVAMTKSCIEYL